MLISDYENGFDGFITQWLENNTNWLYDYENGWLSNTYNLSEVLSALSFKFGQVRDFLEGKVPSADFTNNGRKYEVRYVSSVKAIIYRGRA